MAESDALIASGAPEPRERVIETIPPFKERSLWGSAFRRLIRNRLSLVGLVIFCLFYFCAIFGPFLAPYPYMEQRLNEVAQFPSPQHIFGTDDLGRDFFSRILWGAQTAGVVAITSTASGLIVGVVLGSIAAYGGGWVDWLISRLIDVVMSVPQVLFATLLAATFRQPIDDFAANMYKQTHFFLFQNTAYIQYLVVFGALALVAWPGYARLIRGQILSLRQKEFVEAARSVGLTNRQIILGYLIPNSLGPVIVSVTFGMSGAIVAESGLSFLGVGIQPPQPSWGAMINDNLQSWMLYPWLTILPGLVIGIVSLGINFLGDGLNDALNPRQSI